MDTTVIPQSRADRTAFVNQMFAGRQPADKKSISVTQQLKLLRRDLLAKRKEGFNYREIAAALKESKLKFDVSTSLIKKVLASPAAKRRAHIKKLAALRAANLAASKPTPPATPQAPH